MTAIVVEEGMKKRIREYVYWWSLSETDAEGREMDTDDKKFHDRKLEWDEKVCCFLPSLYL
tara:strand:- start:921 stop:1103 length:183 start_codon:yes stop_codon:yes gene_type:complete